MLEPLTTNEQTTKDSFKFEEEFQSFDCKLLMTSCDIKSFFVNISLQETIYLSVENLFKNRTHVDNLLKNSLRELFMRTMSEPQILFDQEFYKQHDGVAMVPHQDLHLPMFVFVIMKKFGFKIVLFNLNLLSLEGTLMINSYFLARNIALKNFKII